MSRLGAALEPMVPRPKKDKPKRKDVAVKVDEEVVRMARAIASFRGITLAEFLSEMLRPGVTDLFDHLHRERRKPSQS